MRKIIRLIILGFVVFCGANFSFSQNENFHSRSSFGGMLGGSYYIGDLNRYGHFKNTNLSAGLIYRYHLNSRLELRGDLRYGKVEAYDSDAVDAIQRARNLSFESTIFEISSGIEFNYLDYKMGNYSYNFTPYLFVEVGVFSMNPKTEYNGEMVALQPIGTEGQGSSLYDKKPYSLVQFAIPFGLGFKFNVGDRTAISFEYGLRKTFTDYLDDVGGGDYLDREQLAGQNGDIASKLSDRSTDYYKMTGKRGNPTTKDWYSMFGIMITYSLGTPDKCFYLSR